MESRKYDLMLFEFNEFYNFKNIDSFKNKLPKKINVYKNSTFGYSIIRNLYFKLYDININEKFGVVGTFSIINETDNPYYNDMFNEMDFNINMTYNPSGDLIDVYIHGFECHINKTPEFSIKKRMSKLENLVKKIEQNG